MPPPPIDQRFPELREKIFATFPIREKHYLYQTLGDLSNSFLRESLRDEKRDAEGASRDGFSRFAALSSSLLIETTYSPIVAV